MSIHGGVDARGDKKKKKKGRGVQYYLLGWPKLTTWVVCALCLAVRITVLAVLAQPPQRKLVLCVPCARSFAHNEHLQDWRDEKKAAQSTT